MPEIGQNLAHYTLAETIGKGGMGEVFRAKDQKLGRDVAIKVLPEEFARDTERVARFQREAKLLAALNHPNIASIHGLEESDGTHFLVLELAKGETLADRIKSGPIPVEESLRLGLQIAEALEAAHEKGVIHRDLKPPNIKVTPEGKVKVLDFGLAKAFAGDQEEMILSDSPTLSAAATQKGVILGTAGYMSPEQAIGKSVDKRTDIWAFGVVLYEMLTGSQLFAGETASEILASVIKSEPEWKRLPQNLHPRIRLLLERCLEKEAKDRYGVIGDARVDIQKVLADPSGVLVTPFTTAEHRTKLRTAIPWVASIILAAIIVGVVVWNLKTLEPMHVSRFYYEIPEEHGVGTAISPFSALSHDGKKFVYCTNKGLYLRSIDELDAKLIPGTGENPADPFFSPDGQWIGYWSQADGQLKKIAINGGAPVTLTDSDNTGGPIWYKDGTIVYGSTTKGIMRVSSNGGNPEILIPSEGNTLISPQIMPDRKSVIFTIYQNGEFQIVVQSLESGERKVLVEGGCSNKYLSTGHLIYVIGNNLFAVPFDADKLEVTGGPVSLVEGIYRMAVFAPQYAVSDSGALIYYPAFSGAAGVPAQRTLVWVDREGKEEPISAQPNAYGSPRISPDGTKVALVANTGGNQDIWIWDLVRKTLTRLTFDDAADWSPIWTPDGEKIVFRSARKEGIYWKAADGTGNVEHLGSVPNRQSVPQSLSSDGKTLLLEELTGGGTGLNFDIGAMSMEGDHERRPLLEEKYAEVEPRISPDGRWMAYQSNESGQGEVYVRPYPEVDSGGRWQISTNGGGSPLWSPDGQELFYSNNGTVMVVSIKIDPAFTLDTPQILFRGTFYSTAFLQVDFANWDISHDGKRFLMIKPDESTDEEFATEVPRKINIVLNWFEELKERVPVK